MRIVIDMVQYSSDGMSGTRFDRHSTAYVPSPKPGLQVYSLAESSSDATYLPNNFGKKRGFFGWGGGFSPL